MVLEGVFKFKFFSFLLLIMETVKSLLNKLPLINIENITFETGDKFYVFTGSGELYGNVEVSKYNIEKEKILISSPRHSSPIEIPHESSKEFVRGLIRGVTDGLRKIEEKTYHSTAIIYENKKGEKFRIID